ncbi:MAG TPA: hypothetical protein VFY93_19130 [Planctomycetota bacterium]|nr:hypothetical protein [Planctomycetota bacterium]
MKRATWLLFAPVLLLGCRSAPPPAGDAEDEHVRDLEARVAWLETQARMSAFLDDEILDLELQRAAMLARREAGHPAVLDLDRKILALRKVRDLEEHARRDAVRRRLEAERETLLGTYTPAHPKVQAVDAKIAYLRAG